MPDTTTGDAFALTHRGEIAGILERLLEGRVLTTVELDPGHAIVSSVLEVRREVRALVFDIARDPDMNRRLFAADRLSFATELDCVPIAFETAAASLVSLKDGPAAVVELPAKLVRLQRREYFRVRLSRNDQLFCTILDAEGNATPARAVDISCGGAGLVVDREGPILGTPGTGHELILTLPDVGRVEIDATLSNIMAEPLAGAGETPKIRAGFRFDGLRPRTESQIQRYVQRAEVKGRNR